MRQPRPAITIWIERQIDEHEFTIGLALRLLPLVVVIVWVIVYAYPRVLLEGAALTLLLILPPWYLNRRQQRRLIFRRANGLCLHCGYDLRASSHRCPECGAACMAADPAGASPVAESRDLLVLGREAKTARRSK